MGGNVLDSCRCYTFLFIKVNIELIIVCIWNRRTSSLFRYEYRIRYCTAYSCTAVQLTVYKSFPTGIAKTNSSTRHRNVLPPLMYVQSIVPRAMTVSKAFSDITLVWNGGGRKKTLVAARFSTRRRQYSTLRPRIATPLRKCSENISRTDDQNEIRVLLQHYITTLPKVNALIILVLLL